MPAFSSGRHENGQNFLLDPAVIRHIVALVAATSGPLVELGPGRGALTRPLARLGRPLTCVEIDPTLAERLRLELTEVEVVTGDLLRFRLPTAPHVVVGNVPFHLTTAILRRLLRAPCWTEAVLLVQWEVARRRAGIGGGSMMTAQWWPWFEFELGRRIPAAAFRPRPGVDAATLVLRRRPAGLLPVSARRRYQGLVHAVFTGRGRHLPEVLTRAGCFASAGEATRWVRRTGLATGSLPKDLRADHWVDLFRASSAPAAPGAPDRPRRDRPGGRRRPT